MAIRLLSSTKIYLFSEVSQCSHVVWILLLFFLFFGWQRIHPVRPVSHLDHYAVFYKQFHVFGCPVTAAMVYSCIIRQIDIRIVLQEFKHLIFPVRQFIRGDILSFYFQWAVLVDQFPQSFGAAEVNPVRPGKEDGFALLIRFL